MGELPELPKKYRLQDGEICWFCKQPADDDSWRQLGRLHRTHTPIANGRHILYHEPCAVFSNGSGAIPPEGMADEAILRFYAHGESGYGIGLKCKLCGKKGATFGCLHGPCSAVYHFPCARALASKGQVVFSLQSRDMACPKHLNLLEKPHEEDFLGMWMEAGGGWKGSFQEDVDTEWKVVENEVGPRFTAKWKRLLEVGAGGKAAKGGSGGGGRRSSAGGGRASRASSGALTVAPAVFVAAPAPAGPVVPGVTQAAIAAAAAAVIADGRVSGNMSEVMRTLAAGFAPQQQPLQPLQALPQLQAPQPPQPPQPPPISLRPGAKPRRWASVFGLCTGSDPCTSTAATPEEHVHPDLPAYQPPYTGPRPRPAPAVSDVKLEHDSSAADAAAGGGPAAKRQRVDPGGGASAAAAGPLALPVGTPPEVAAMFNLMLGYGKSWGTTSQPDARDLTQALADALGGTAAGPEAANAVAAVTAALQQHAPAGGAAAATAAAAAARKQAAQQLAPAGAAMANGRSRPASGRAALQLPKLAQYFGCVSTVPPLQPGEVRALGVTAHADLASSCSLPHPPPTRAAAAALLTMPAAAAQQLAEAGVAPESVLQQLRDALEGSEDVSGWAGLPADIPARLAEGCVVAGTDPRPLLRRELALRTTVDVAPGTLVGPFRSYALGQDAYLGLTRTVPPDWGATCSPATRAHEWVELVHRYTLALPMPSPAGAPAAAPSTVYFCALGYGNMTCLANDPREHPNLEGPEGDAMVAEPNAAVVVCLLGGLPLPVMVSLRAVPAGDELLIDNGAGYWQAWRMLRRNTDNAARGVGGP